MVPLFGGRRWTAFSTGILIVPCVWLGFAVRDTSTPLALSLLFPCCVVLPARTLPRYGEHQLFFPKQSRGGALGLNGGLGNMGVSVMRLDFAPLVVSLSIFAAFGGHGVETAGRFSALSGEQLDLGAHGHFYAGGVVRHERTGDV